MSMGQNFWKLEFYLHQTHIYIYECMINEKLQECINHYRRYNCWKDDPKLRIKPLFINSDVDYITSVM